MADTEQTPATPETPPVTPPTEPQNRPWYEGRIDTLTRQRREAEEAAAAKDREIAELKAKLTPAAPTPPATPTPTAPSVPLNEVERIANERAKALADQATFDRQANEIYTRGMAAHGADFQRALDQLKMAGGLARHHVEAAVEAGNPEKILMELAKDPAEAARVLALSPVQGIAAIAKMGARLGSTPTKPISGRTRSASS